MKSIFHFFSLWGVKNAVIAGAFFLMCMHYENDNPCDPAYPSSRYKLKVNWDMFPDTCFINTPYTIDCETSVGKDTFDHFFGRCKAEDLSFKVEIMKLNFHSFTISFNKEMQGELIIFGLQPNGRSTVSDTGNVLIINQSNQK